MDETNMDVQSTPVATQPFFDPRRREVTNTQASRDAADIIVILHPTTQTAIEAVRTTAQLSPQHILQNETVNPLPEDVDLEPLPIPGTDQHELVEGQDADDGQRLKLGQDSELALRFSSEVRSPLMGFTFGRNERDCDVVLKQDRKKIKVSNIHFRIYISDDGVVMLQDCSTNGTFLDEKILRSKEKHILQNGSKIEVVTYTDTTSTVNYQERAVFVVTIPYLDTETAQLYGENFLAYRAKRDAQRPQGNGNAAHSVSTVTRTARGLLGIGKNRANHGMQWDGAPTYSVVDQIGKGAFAIVYKITTRNEGKIYAAKEIQKGRMNSRNLDEKIVNEISIMKRVIHPHVIKLYDSHDIGSHLYLILEMMNGGDLLRHFSLSGCLREDMAQTVSKQLCHALEYIHSINITHRDIKPDNILIKNLEPMWVKLSDFGLSKMIEEEGGAAMRTFCGTMLYCAPEVYPDYTKYTKADQRVRKDDPSAARYESNVDIWSLGAVLFHLLAGDPPFEGRAGTNGNEMLQTVLRTVPDFATLRRKISIAGVEFLQSCLQINPGYRPSARDCLQDVWLCSVEDVVSDLPIPASKKARLDATLGTALGISGIPSSLPSEALGSTDSWIADPERAQAFLKYRQASPMSDPDAVELPIQTKAADEHQKLFGEVVSGLPDSGIFGMNQQPVIQADQTTRNSATPDRANTSDEGSALNSTVSHVQDLTIGSPTHLSIQVPTTSFLKRHREDESTPESLKKSTKRVMSRSGRQIVSEKTFGKLVPVAGSIAEAEELILRGSISAWGRSPSSSHRWPAITDTRIPKSGMDLVFWSPSIASFTANMNFDWINANLARDAASFPPGMLEEMEVYLKTRSSQGIRVNDVQLNRASDGQSWPVVKLRTGDVITIFDFKEEGFLRYRCEFNMGQCRNERRAGETTRVEFGTDVQRWSEKMNQQRAAQHKILT